MSAKLPDIDMLLEILDKTVHLGQDNVLHQAGMAYVELVCAMGGILQLKQRLGQAGYLALCKSASNATEPSADQLRVLSYTNTVARHTKNGANL